MLNEDNTYNTVEYIEGGLEVHGHAQSVHLDDHLRHEESQEHELRHICNERRGEHI